MQPLISRRQALQWSATGFGYLAFNALQQQTQAANVTHPAPHFEPKVKRVIFMFMEGGPSHVDSFDYKPALSKYTDRKSVV